MKSSFVSRVFSVALAEGKFHYSEEYFTAQCLRSSEELEY